jgi:uncharacterized protein YdhG (YjbR/CyaY superfamily)
MAKISHKSIKDYIASKPTNLQKILKQVRSTIREALPQAEEEISYQIPVYKLNGIPVIYFAGWAEHFSLYPINDALIAEFKKELAPYKQTKGTVRFPLSEPVPVNLIKRLAKFRARQLTMREKGSRTKSGETQLDRVRRLCATVPAVFEKVSHGAPAFFVEKGKGLFAMFADDHHQDGHLAVWVPAPDGLQSALIEDAPDTYFKPPYVGSSGWIGIELARVDDHALQIHIRQAWDLTAGRKKTSQRRAQR